MSERSNDQFIHLRVHTAYSLAEGAITHPQLIQLCREMSMPTVGVADTDNLFGAMAFSRLCADVGIHPIIGCQLAIRRDDTAAAPDWLVLLCENEAGYLNLIKLVSTAHLTGGKNGMPQVTLADVESRSDGLIVLTGGPSGPVGRLLAEGLHGEAKAMLTRLSAAFFPDRIFVELQRHGADVEKHIEGQVVGLARELGLPLVATNEAFFANRAMYEAHDVLLCIGEGALQSQKERHRVTAEHYFKSPAEMRRLFADLPEACDNTLVIADRCRFSLGKRIPSVPSYPTGDETETDSMGRISREGLEERLREQFLRPETTDRDFEQAAKPYRERLDQELSTIGMMGVSGYFLIAADFILMARAHGIPVGPGSAGSVAAWALAITDFDPLRSEERFEDVVDINVGPFVEPYFGIDIATDQLDGVIAYLRERYGVDQVAKIIRFGRLEGRELIRVIGRVLQVPSDKIDREICNLIPESPISLEAAIGDEPRLLAMRGRDPVVGHLFDIAMQLEGLFRSYSVEPEVVIADQPLDGLVPLCRDPRSFIPVTQFDTDGVSRAGLVRFRLSKVRQ